MRIWGKTFKKKTRVCGKTVKKKMRFWGNAITTAFSKADICMTLPLVFDTNSGYANYPGRIQYRQFAVTNVGI